MYTRELLVDRLAHSTLTMISTSTATVAKKSINETGEQGRSRETGCWCHGVMSLKSRSGQLFGTGKGPSGRQCPRLVNRTSRKETKREQIRGDEKRERK